MTKKLIGSLELNRIYQQDCIEGMKMIPDGSVDMILCDLPYGTTACKWDTIIPFEPLWKQYERIIKINGAIVLSASQPFTSEMITSNIRLFRYCWYWNKTRPTGFANAKKQPLRNVEDIAVFYKKPPTYNPQGIVYIGKTVKNSVSAGGESVRGELADSRGKGSLRTAGASYVQEYTNYPRQTIAVGSESRTVHPTQKPVDLFRYLIRTYTNPGEIVLDNCMGSGTTAVAATLEGRDWIGFETSSEYVEVANKRLDSIASPQN